jgi:hypothetical protein
VILVTLVRKGLREIQAILDRRDCREFKVFKEKQEQPVI